MEVADTSTPVVTSTPIDTSTPEDLTPEVEAALSIQHGLKMFDNMLKDVTGSQAKRVLEAVMKHPLEDMSKNFTTHEAVKLYNLCDFIQSKKFILFQLSLEQQVQEEINKQNTVDTNNGSDIVNSKETYNE